MFLCQIFSVNFNQILHGDSQYNVVLKCVWVCRSCVDFLSYATGFNFIMKIIEPQTSKNFLKIMKARIQKPRHTLVGKYVLNKKHLTVEAGGLKIWHRNKESKTRGFTF